MDLSAAIAFLNVCSLRTKVTFKSQGFQFLTGNQTLFREDLHLHGGGVCVCVCPVISRLQYLAGWTWNVRP